jgi:nucleoside-diphosphate-sugar epimerase
MGKKVLVTGGCGYIGSVLVPLLLHSGYEVRVVDKLYFGEESLAAVRSEVELVAGDVRHVDLSVLDGIDGVIHLGSLSNDPTAEFRPDATRSINYVGTVRLASACKERGISRFTFASSCAVYGFRVDGLADEGFPTNPQSSYAKSKLEAEKELCEMADDSFCPVSIRQATLFGLSPRMRWDLVANAFVMHAFRDRRLDVWFGGEAYRPLVHVRDAARAHLCCLEAERSRVQGKVFNLVHSNCRILDLATRIQKCLTEMGMHAAIEVNSDRSDDRSYMTSGQRMKEELGFSPAVTIEDGVREIADELSNGRHRDFDHPIYYNMPWMHLLLEIEDRLRKTGPVL